MDSKDIKWCNEPVPNCENYADFEGRVVRRGAELPLFYVKKGERGLFDSRSSFQLYLSYVSRDKIPKIKIENDSEKWKQKVWALQDSPSAIIDGQKSVLYSIFVPHDANIGTYKVKITKSGLGEKNVSTSMLYVVANPWNSKDEAYIEEKILREEYVQNNDTIIYVGSSGYPMSKFWDLSLNDPQCIEATFQILDKSSADKKANLVNLTRELAAMVNSNDDNGILVGNWSGNYSDGHSPTSWSNSKEILRKWLKTGRPVRYGQCFTFGAVLATLCRVVGVGCRVITNFSSHHDSDGSLNYELYYDKNDELLDISSESVWNFHVWNECFFKRYDMADQYSGWQVIDGTPQERSNGRFTLGPAPKLAIIRGEVDSNYDTGFVYAEVNADMVYLREPSGSSSSGQKEVLKVQPNKIGINISTKAPMRRAREEITNTYKYVDDPKKLRETKIAVAARIDRNYEIPEENLSSDSTNECQLEIHASSKMQITEDLSFVLNLKPAENCPSIAGKVVYSVYLVNSKDKLVGRIDNSVIQIPNIKDKFQQKITISNERVCRNMKSEFPIVKIVAMVLREDSGKPCDFDFRPVTVVTPNIDIHVPPKVSLGVPFQVQVKFVNTLKTAIPAGKVYLEGSPMAKRKGYTFSKLEPNDVFSFTHTVEIKKKAPDQSTHFLIGSLDCSSYPCISDRVDIAI